MADTQDTPAPIEADDSIDLDDVSKMLGARDINLFKLQRSVDRLGAKVKALTDENAALGEKLAVSEAKSITRTIEDVAEEIAGKVAEASVNGKAKP